MSSRRNRLGVVLVAGALGILGGCVDNDISVATVDFVAPDTAMTGCVYDTASLPLLGGTYDALLAKALGNQSAYFVAPAVQNELNLISTQAVSTQVAFVKSFDVQLVPHGLVSNVFSASDLSYSAEVAETRLAPQETSVFQVPAILGKFASAIANLPDDPAHPSSITFNARPVYTRAEEQHTGAYASFPIDICFGCLAGKTFPLCSDIKGQTPLAGNACNYAADLSVTCCVNSMNALVCGSAVTAAEQATP